MTEPLWNRLEGRPRTTDFDRALHAEVRDPLWLLTRQWQLGEFHGTDGGSPVTVTYSVAQSRPSRFRPLDGPPEGLPADRPLETVAERRRLPFTYGAEKIAFDLRLAIGHRWFKRKLVDELAARRDAANKALQLHDTAATGPDRVRAATDALKALLGEDVLSVPEFTPPQAVIQQWRKARADSDKLVAHLRPARDFPVDDWLHGMARVREKPRLWEQAVVLSDALFGPSGLLGTGLPNRSDPDLSPVQLLFVQGDHWLGLEFAKDPKLPNQLGEDRLLFTAHYATGLSGDQQCGLLLDEWTEVIPAERETTGVAVHYNGPDSEPPQAMLLVVPPVRVAGGQWATTDLVDAITETFELAKTRAVEPAHVGATAFAHLLPAAVLPATPGDTGVPHTDFAQANLRWRTVR
jgi:hypothetical protein